MKATERNERLYNTLVSFTENDIVPNDSNSYTDEYIKAIKMLYASQYIETIIERFGQTEFSKIKSRKYGITLKGWQFMEYYESHKANQKLMSIQLEDYKNQNSYTKVLIGLNIVIALSGIIAYFYKDNENSKLTKENMVLRDSIVLFRNVSYPTYTVPKDTTNKTPK